MKIQITAVAIDKYQTDGKQSKIIQKLKYLELLVTLPFKENTYKDSTDFKTHKQHYLYL